MRSDDVCVEDHHEWWCVIQYKRVLNLEIEPLKRHLFIEKTNLDLKY